MRQRARPDLWEPEEGNLPRPPIVVSSFFPNVFGLNGRTNESQSTVQLPMTANFRGKAHFPLEKLLTAMGVGGNYSSSPVFCI